MSPIPSLYMTSLSCLPPQGDSCLGSEDATQIMGHCCCCVYIDPKPNVALRVVFLFLNNTVLPYHVCLFDLK
jgi:hypothetical protein